VLLHCNEEPYITRKLGHYNITVNHHNMHSLKFLQACEIHDVTRFDVKTCLNW